MDQLIRETQPPAGTLRSPVPQYWNPDTEKYERVLGVHGAPRAMLYGPNGQPISTSNRLPVDVGAQVATESTLAEAVSRLNAISTRLEGTLDVDVGGQIHADVDLGDVTVQIGEVQQGKRGQNAEPWEVTLSGRRVSQIIFPRALRTTSDLITLTTPSGALGCLIWSTVYGSTGTFGSGEGFILRAYLKNAISITDIRSYRLETTGMTGTGAQGYIFVYPGVQTEFPSSGAGSSISASLPVTDLVRVGFRITGQFDSGQGIDCEVGITWLG